MGSVSLDQATDALHDSQRAMDQAKMGLRAGSQRLHMEERQIAEANVQKAIADITAVQFGNSGRLGQSSSLTAPRNFCALLTFEVRAAANRTTTQGAFFEI